jgi:hypothetical protein
MAIKMGRVNALALAGTFLRAAAIAGLVLKGSRHIPRTIKWLVLFILALNLRGFPLVWHCQYALFIYMLVSNYC